MEYRYRTEEELKDSGIKWLGKIPKNWELKRNRHIFDFRRREVNNHEDTTVLSLTTNGVKVKENLSFGKSTESYIGHQLVYPGDIVFTPRDFDQTPILSGVSDYYGCISNLYFVMKCKNDINNYFVNYFWWGIKYKVDFFKNFSYGIRYGYNYDQFKDLIFLNPSYVEQKKIADFLDEKTSQFNAIISKKETLIETLEEAKKSLISELVTGKVKVVKNTNGYELVQRSSDEMKDSGIEWLGNIPNSWEVKRIKYVMYECKGKSETGIEEPLSMSQKYGLIKTSDMENIPNQATSLVGNKIVKVNDLVFNKLKPHLGVFSVSKYDGIVSPDYAVYGAKKNVNIKYLEYLFKTTKYINEFKKYATGVGAGLTRLYTEQLFNIQAIVPTYDEQCIIEEIITMKIVDMAETIGKTKYQIEKLKEAKQSLISEAVTGKIEVLN